VNIGPGLIYGILRYTHIHMYICMYVCMHVVTVYIVYLLSKLAARLDLPKLKCSLLKNQLQFHTLYRFSTIGITAGFLGWGADPAQEYASLTSCVHEADFY
jgi:hypothetical protein